MSARRLLLHAGLALGTTMLAVPAGALARTTPPPVPDCATVASFCLGVQLKSAIDPAPLTAAHDGVFTLTGPKPLQTKAPASCGDAGCIYNHLDWHVGTGGVVKSGCAANATTCSVTVAANGPEWVPVVVTENDYPQAFFLVWRVAGSKTISGTITKAGKPLAGVAVRARGPHGAGSGVTGTNGRYEVGVPKGNGYEVGPAGKGTFTPKHRTVNVTGDVGGQDFRAEGQTVKLAPTAGQMICNRTGDASPFACTVTIGDASTTGTPTAPTGPVTFDAPGGVFTSGSSCSLQPTPGSPSVSSCTVAYVNPKIEIGVAPPVTAIYAGDATHGPTTVQEKLFNAVPDLADPPDICLGDDGSDLCAGLDVDLRNALSLSDDDTSLDLDCYETDADSQRRSAAQLRQLGGQLPPTTFGNPAFGTPFKPQSQACKIRTQIEAKRQQIKKLEEAERLAKQVEADQNAAAALRKRAAERQRRIDALLHSWNSDTPDATAAAVHRSALGLGIAQATIPFHGHKRLRLVVPPKARPYVDALRSAGIKSLRVVVRVSVLRPGDTKVTTATRTVTMKLGKR